MTESDPPVSDWDEIPTDEWDEVPTLVTKNLSEIAAAARSVMDREAIYRFFGMAGKIPREEIE